MSDASSNISTAGKSSPNWLIAVSAVLVVLFLFFASQTVGGLMLGVYAALQHWNAAQINAWLANSTSAQFVYGLIAEGLMVVGVGVALRWLRWRWADIGLTKPKLLHLIMGFVSVVPYFVFYLVLVAILSAIFPGLNVGQKQEIGFTDVHGSFELLLAFTGLVILPPIAEEITMRGFLYTGLKKWLPTLLAALAVSVLFGTAHLAEGGSSGPLWIGAIDTLRYRWYWYSSAKKPAISGRAWCSMPLRTSLRSPASFLLNNQT